MLEIEIRHSYEINLGAVKDSLAKASFYQKNNLSPVLPKGIKMGDTYSVSLSGIVEKEYASNLDIYDEASKEILRDWNLYKDELFNFFNKFSYQIPSKVIIYLAGYGPGGGYTLPDEILVLVPKRSINTYLDHVVHEIIHILFEETIVKKYDLGHLEKENLVESMYTHPALKKIFPNHAFMLSFSMPEKDLLQKVSWR